MNKPIRVKFIDDHYAFSPMGVAVTDGMEYAIIKRAIPNCIVVQDNPHIVVTMGFGQSHLQYACPKICIRFENTGYLSDVFDVILHSNADISHMPRTHIVTNAIQLPEFEDLITRNVRPHLAETPKTKFCAFLYSNDFAKPRKEFCKKLMDYKRVDCMGQVLHNTDIPEGYGRDGQWEQTQLQIYKDYKFVIAFENSSADGYVTEKIVQALLAGAVPIYWGADDIKQYVNPECFVNVNDFKNFSDCIAYVKKLDTDADLYNRTISAPPILPDSKFHCMTIAKLGDWLKPHIEYILSPEYTPIGKQSAWGKVRYKLHRKYYGRKLNNQQKYCYNAKIK